MPKISDLLEAIESRIPKAASETWDNVGLLCGDAKQAFRAAVIGVDLTEALLAKALQSKANLIIIHHPPLFPKGRGIGKLILGASNELNTLMLRCFQKNICVLVAHTNFDRCALDGMMRLAHDLGGEAYARVWETPKEGETLLKKLVTYVPETSFVKVRDALYSVGCGHVGNYDSCGFGLVGTGNFRPLQGAKPKIGKVGTFEEVKEIRFETLVVAGMENVVLETLKNAHPYEEVAYDFYAVEQLPPTKGLVWGLGYGFIAELSKPVSYNAFTRKVKSVFKVKNFLTNQFTPKFVKKIAFTPGKGSSFVNSVKAQKVDVFITGEVGYHSSLEAERAGFNIMELGHRESEHYFLRTFEAWFKEFELEASVLDERTQRII
ncbi:MAG: Nif3-like dinuclear metal center hexameric protein [Bdellovibrionales bacterium]|nr:Nif3-like dinuclear metal center hexameric protein [Oligoflexia bacterium]